ncbi:MAG: hypothetical protein P857_96 [Candidatus Xenolissoclinum pacificiensis L6]|uniref:Uncharacterized protein n=1 Tax=Candidatus Xenolissoclinum pacificiensis L6 TaxID=1401685 RepID=W2UY29_9RICK|nr:MAG: hypothetical protein P857_96 [Candidatus Xenolissoclinum pacificiensis L6]
MQYLTQAHNHYIPLPQDNISVKHSNEDSVNNNLENNI